MTENMSVTSYRPSGYKLRYREYSRSFRLVVCLGLLVAFASGSSPAQTPGGDPFGQLYEKFSSNYRMVDRRERTRPIASL